MCDDFYTICYDRVLASARLTDLRKIISSQLGFDVVPENYVFLRSVGRNFTQVTPQQEKDLKAKYYMPPVVSEPEIYLKEGSYIGNPNCSPEEESGEDKTHNKSHRSTDIACSDMEWKASKRRTRRVIGGTRSTSDFRHGSEEVKGNKQSPLVKDEETEERDILNSKGRHFEYRNRGEYSDVEDMKGKTRLDKREKRTEIRGKHHGLSSNRKENVDLKSQSTNQNLRNSGTQPIKEISECDETNKKETVEGSSPNRQRVKSSEKRKNRKQKRLAQSSSLDKSVKEQSIVDSARGSSSGNTNDKFVIEKTSIKLLDSDGRNMSNDDIREMVKFIEGKENDPEVENGADLVQERNLTSEEDGYKDSYIVTKTVTERSKKVSSTADEEPNDRNNEPDGSMTFVTEYHEEWIENNNSEGIPYDLTKDGTKDEASHNSTPTEPNPKITDVESDITWSVKEKGSNGYAIKQTVTREKRTETRSRKLTSNSEEVPKEVHYVTEKLVENDISGLYHHRDDEKQESEVALSAPGNENLKTSPGKYPEENKRGRIRIEVCVKELGETTTQTDSVGTDNITEGNKSSIGENDEILKHHDTETRETGSEL
ncbi:uncharacterized protein LOC143233808 [Tachypleus tridentatus]|uniref:uncharacterized protein LOC143233808 n=1 Tax=Tachypleus tridentatus TaxID=6853 RepID=UPI003FD5C54D